MFQEVLESSYSCLQSSVWLGDGCVFNGNHMWRMKGGLHCTKVSTFVKYIMKKVELLSLLSAVELEMFMQLF